MRVIYVENDPALRGVMTTFLSEVDGVEVVCATGLAQEALDPVLVARADVALLDLALGTTQMTGIDLGLALRAINPDIGVVIHSQYPLDTVARTVPQELLIGWATVPKSGEMSIEDLVDVLRQTCRGVSTITASPSPEAPSLLTLLSMRQRAVMSLAATGVNAQEIAKRLGTSYAAVRQELSNAYRILAPDAGPTDDRRTRAILTYLELSRDDHDE